MMRIATALLTAIAALILASCSIEKTAADRDTAIVRAAYDSIASNDAAAFGALLRDDIASEAVSNIAAFHNAMPTGGVKTATLVRGVQNVSYPNTRNAAELEYELSDGETFSIFRAAIGDTANGRRIIAFNITRLPASVNEISGFSLQNKLPKQYVFLVATIASPLIILAALWTMFRAGRFERRWLWVVGSLCAVCSFRMDWYSGQTAINVLNVQILGAGFFKVPDPTAPWILMFGFPFVAIVFLGLRPDRKG